MNIGITGTICSGKSSVSRLLGKLLGVEVLSADALCENLLEKGNAGYIDVVNCWGERFLDFDDCIDRLELRKAIFDDSSIRTELEQILHPLVHRQILESSREAQKRNSWLVVEVPLLFEVGWQGNFNKTVLVFADSEICLQRLMIRDGANREQGEKILAAQMEACKKVLLADSVINNSGSWARTYFQVIRLVNNLDNKLMV